jgi:hypothetical protein
VREGAIEDLLRVLLAVEEHVHGPHVQVLSSSVGAWELAASTSRYTLRR